MNFLEAAKERFKKEDYNLTCFLAEQSIQLYLKAYILEITGENLPRTHSLRKLLSLIQNLTGKKFNYDRNALLMLENAYYIARYFDFDYEKEDAELALNIVKDVINFVESIKRGE